MNRKAFVVSIALLVAISSFAMTASAGISPGWNTGEDIEIEQGDTRTVELYITSDMEGPEEVEIELSGNLSQYVELEQNFVLEDGEDFRIVEITIDHGDLELFDNEGGSLTVTQSPEGESGSDVESEYEADLSFVVVEPERTAGALTGMSFFQTGLIFGFIFLVLLLLVRHYYENMEEEPIY